MNNKEFLQFIYDRMINIHLESPNVDYMIWFKELIKQYPIETVVQMPIQDMYLENFHWR